MIAATTKMPMKFECIHCNKIYMHQYPTNAISFYPTCPDCEQAGLLLGTADTIDIVKHPKTFAKTLIKQISHKLGKSH